jgi:GDPmannose 4,6-dehydratase
MLQQDEPEDYVIATGVQYSVREFIEFAAKSVDIDITWKGKDAEEKGYDNEGNCIVEVDPRYYRPTEVESLLGDPTKAKEKLGWTPTTNLNEMIDEMMQRDMLLVENEVLIYNK